MIAALGLITASLLSTALPPLPERGLVLETAAGVQLRSMQGRPIVTIPGLDLALDKKVSSYLVLRDRRGRLFTLDFRARAVRRFYDYPQHPLAQWLAECETPVAYRIANGRMQAYGRESVALGFMPGGAALIHFPNGPCAGDSRGVRGIYSVPLYANARLVLRTPRFAQYAMWGG